MSPGLTIIWLLLGGVAGIVAASLYWHGRVAAARREADAAAAVLQERLRLREEQLAEAATAAAAHGVERQRCADAAAELKIRLAEQQATLVAERHQSAEKLKLLDESRRQLADQFKLLANDIFEAKSKQFNQASGERLETVLKPLRERLGEFVRKVEETHEKGVRERATIRQLIESLTEKNQLLGAEAHNLANALRGQVKTQGNWGEMVLARVLDASGLEQGLAYEVQESHVGEDGRRYQPDVIVRLPDHKHLIIDAKVSLVAYERYTTEEIPEEERAKALREHVQSLRNHLKSLGDKQYQGLPGIESPDFVFMFIPIETAYTLALREETRLFEEASQRKIVIVTPSTLLASLRLIHYLWQQEKQSRNAAETAALAGRLYDKLADFVKSLEQVGGRLKQAQESYDQAIGRLSSGRGNALRLAERIRELGAPAAKSLPRHLTDEDADAEADSPPELLPED